MNNISPYHTQLVHEHVGFDELKLHISVAKNGGWDRENKVFVPVTDFSKMISKKRPILLDVLPEAPKLAILFLDFFTAAVEASQLDEDNWQTAFENPEDWKSLTYDMAVQLSSHRFHDRHYSALKKILDEDPGHTYARAAEEIRFQL